MQFTTERTVLNLLQNTDYSEIINSFGEQGAVKYVKHLQNLTHEKYIEFLEKKQLLSQEQKLFYWVVREKETQKFVGTIGLTPYLASKQTFHLGFRVSKEFQEKGLATELGKKVIDFVKNELKHKKIIGLIMEGNIASKALLKKLNFEFEKSYFDTDYQIQLEVYRLEF